MEEDDERAGVRRRGREEGNEGRRWQKKMRVVIERRT